MKKVKFNYDILEDIVKDIIKKDKLIYLENTKATWIEDENEKLSNMIMEFDKNEWNLHSFTFVDMSMFSGGLSIMFIFSDDCGVSSISYQRTFAGIGEMLVDDSAFKNMLTYVKSNKDKINFEKSKLNFF